MNTLTMMGQGQRFSGYIDDPAYSRMVRDFINGNADFVFEEAGGNKLGRPTSTAMVGDPMH